MTREVSYADTRHYVQHFRNQGCQADIVDNTDGLINLFWLNVDFIHQLKCELEKKTVNIFHIYPKRLRFRIYGTPYSPPDRVEIPFLRNLLLAQ